MTTTALAPAEYSLSSLAALATASVHSEESRRTYEAGIRCFAEWLQSHRGEYPQVSKAAVQAWVTSLEQQGLAPATIGVRLTAVRKLFLEAADNGLMDAGVAGAIARVKGPKVLGRRIGNWLSTEQARALVSLDGIAGIGGEDRNPMKTTRDRALLALLIGCGLRRSELAALQVSQIQERDGRPCLVDIVGKGGRIRTVGIPAWAYERLYEWVADSGITEGPVFRSVSKSGEVGQALSAFAVWSVVTEASERAGVRVAPHDLRRTHARQARRAGCDLEQIQYSLGHSSVVVTQRYIGGNQDLQRCPGDFIGL